MVQPWHVLDDLWEQRARELQLEAERERLARQLPPRASTLRLALASACRILADRLEQHVMCPSPQERQMDSPTQLGESPRAREDQLVARNRPRRQSASSR